MFRVRRGTSLADEIYGVINGVTTGFVIEIFILFFWRPLVYSRLIFVYATVLMMLFIILARVVRRSVLSYLRSRGVGLDRVLIVGVENVGLTVMRNLIAQPELGFEVVGFVDDNPERGQTNIGRFRALGHTDRLPQHSGGGGDRRGHHRAAVARAAHNSRHRQSVRAQQRPAAGRARPLPDQPEHGGYARRGRDSHALHA